MMKYGIFVPSFDTASSCSTTSFAASKWVGSLCASFRVTAAASPTNTEDGARKPVMVRKKESLVVLVSVSSTDTFCGTGRAFRVQPARVGE